MVGCSLQVSTQMGAPGADADKLMARMDELQSAIDAANGWELERQLTRATDALRCPPGAAAIMRRYCGQERARPTLNNPFVRRPGF